MSAPPLSEAEILDTAISALGALLPTDWRLEFQREPPRGRTRPDAVVAVVAPNGERALLVAEVKRSVVTRDLLAMLEGARASLPDSAVSGEGTATVLLVARYFAPALQQWMTERNVAYADASGNVRVALERPALFVRDIGARKDPWRGPGRPKGNLTGASAARIVRALVDYRPPYTVPELMKLAGTPSGTTYRAVEYIRDQALLSRAENGRIIDVSWRALLERWSSDYSFAALARDGAYLAPRGLPDLMSRLAELRATPEPAYAVTGSLATPKWEAYAPARSAMIYTESPRALAELLDLRKVETGANVLLAESRNTAALERTQLLDRTVVVGPSQAAVDLLTAPGRGPEEGRVLLDWMERNEDDWRQ